MSSKQNATPARSIDDQIVIAVDILCSAELHDVAVWIKKNATAIAESNGSPPRPAAVALASIAKSASSLLRKIDAMDCSFCENSRHDVKLMIAGHSGFICNDCVRECVTVVAERVDKIAETSEPFCTLCGETETARGGDIHGCGGDCDAFNHGEPGGCHKFVLPTSEPSRPESLDSATDDRIATEITAPTCANQCIQTVNLFGYPLPKPYPHSDYDGVHGGKHNPFCDDTDATRAACRCHEPLYGPASYWTRHRCDGRPTYRCPACWACAYSEDDDVLRANLHALGYPPIPTTATETSHSVKEAIAAYEAHRPCEGDKGRADCPDSFCACMEARKFGPLIAALADAERKLADAIEAKAAIHELWCARGDGMAILERKLADAEKRAKDAEAENLCGHVICRERHFTAQHAALTRKLATAREALNRLRRVDTDNVCPHAPNHGIGRVAELLCYSLIAKKAIAAIDAPTGEEAGEPIPRIIDGKFRAEVRDGRVVIVKSSSGEIVPDDEPLILQRGRDRLMVAMLNYYRKLSQLDGCNDYHMAGVDRVIARFTAYASDPSRMKQPGITRGAAWNPDAPPPEPPIDQTTPNPPADWDRVLTPEPANAQGSGAAPLPWADSLGSAMEDDMESMTPSEERAAKAAKVAPQRLTAEEARDCASWHETAAVNRDRLGQTQNAEDSRRLAATLRAFADLLDRDDALERAAEAVALFHITNPSDLKVAIDDLRTVLAQRAGKVAK